MKRFTSLECVSPLLKSCQKIGCEGSFLHEGVLLNILCIRSDLVGWSPTIKPQALGIFIHAYIRLISFALRPRWRKQTFLPRVFIFFYFLDRIIFLKNQIMCRESR